MIRACELCGDDFDARARQRTCRRCSAACAICGGPTKTLGLCGRHHMQWLRADKPDLPDFVVRVRAGEPVGRVSRPCAECGAEFRPDRSQKTCSQACADARRRRRQREAKRREWQQRADEIRRQARERRRERPEVYRAQDKRKWRRLKTDPEKHAKARRQNRAFYRRNSRRIQAERRRREREKLARMSQPEVEAYIERQRAYQRRWRRKMRRDPERLAADQDAQRRYRRARRRQRLGEEMLAVLAAAANPRPAKPCAVCGGPVIGRRPTAKTCGPACAEVRRKENVRRWRGDKRTTCVVCGREFARRTSTNTCSPECRAKRRKEMRRGQEDRREKDRARRHDGRRDD